MSTAQFAAMDRGEAVRFMADAPVQAVRRRMAEIVGTRTVVDLGCGKGEEIGTLYVPEQYTGIDCSEELIGIARVRNPAYRFLVGLVQEVTGYWEVGIIKSVLEHLPPDEAVAVYERARTVVDLLLVAWHTEPGGRAETVMYAGELRAPMRQSRHPRELFPGVVAAREVWGPHVLWVVP